MRPLGFAAWSRRVDITLALLTIAWLGLGTVRGQIWGAYHHGGSADTTNPSWMSSLADDTPLSRLSIPATHDSMALFGGDITQCQSLTLATQLASGIRGIDIRCRHVGNHLDIYHGIIYQRANLDHVLRAVQSFLTQNPREAVLMRVKEESVPDGSTRSFADSFVWYASRYPGLLWKYTSDNPTLGEIRGKIVVLQNFAGPVLGISWDTISVQDKYNLDSRWDLYGKWESVKSQLGKASGGDLNLMYGNFLSGSGLSLAFPWFVAGGVVSPDDRRLCPTGLTTLLSPGLYPDFPRSDCIWVVCSIDFLGINMLAANYLDSNPGRVGILFADFPGGELINRIIKLNQA